LNDPSSPSIGTKKPGAIEVDQVRWRIGDPHLGFPRNLPKVPFHDGPVPEGSYIDQAGLRSSEQSGQLGVSLGIDRPMAGDRLYQQQPVAPHIVENNVRHFAVHIHVDTQLCQQGRIQVSPLVTRVADVDQHTPRCEARCKVIDDSSGQVAVLAGAEGDFLPGAICTGIRFCARS
jgi:hypothetical protein